MAAEAARLEAARLAAVKLEAARIEAARQEAVRTEAARLAAERQEAERQAAARQEAARQEAASQEGARQAAARQDSARLQAIKEAAERREALLRDIGRQLDDERARREAAAAVTRQSAAGPGSSASTARRARLFGRTDSNTELVLYAEAWSRKIQLNLGIEQMRDATRQPHTAPVVTVAVRSDGSVESVSFVRSSGVTAIDDAVRAIVQAQAPYQQFPPSLAREFDVVEIRRTWYFDTVVRLY